MNTQTAPDAVRDVIAACRIPCSIWYDKPVGEKGAESILAAITAAGFTIAGPGQIVVDEPDPNMQMVAVPAEIVWNSADALDGIAHAPDRRQPSMTWRRILAKALRKWFDEAGYVVKDPALSAGSGPGAGGGE